MEHSDVNLLPKSVKFWIITPKGFGYEVLRSVVPALLSKR
jgi:hypothetical protein